MQLISDDLSVDRKAVMKVSMNDVENPTVLTLCLSLFVIPENQLEKDEYESQVGRLSRYIKNEMRKYVLSNQGLFDKRMIVDVNFTSANLKKGYNKSVQVSVYVKVRNELKFQRIVKRVKETVKPSVNAITDRVRRDGSKCFKKKQSYNNKVR